MFVDTPGIIKPKYEMQSMMMDYIDRSLAETDVICLLVDLADLKREDSRREETKREDTKSENSKGDDKKSIDVKSAKEYFHSSVIEKVKNAKKPIILILNKIDTFIDIKSILPIILHFQNEGIYDEIIPISARKTSNIDELIKCIEKYLPEAPFLFDEETLSTQNERFFVSEIIREQVFLKFAEEIPYSTEISVTQFKERENGKWFISADIIVERKNQKMIVVGKSGEKIKLIGEKARVAIEEHLQMPVYLELFVKVRENWRENPAMLRSYGY
jgi:GTP-binding protein Era